MTIEYYHPSVGTYYERKGIQLRASDLAIGGAAAGLGLAALPRNSKALAIPAGIGGALLSNLLAPKKILSWYDPPPEGKPAVYPPDIPNEVVPSYIDDDGLVLDWLMYEDTGQQIKDYSKYGNHGTLQSPATRVSGSMGWAVAFNGISQYATLKPIVFPDGSEWSWEGWIYLRENFTGHYALFSNGGLQPLLFISGNELRPYYYSLKYTSATVGIMYQMYLNLKVNAWNQVGVFSHPDRVDFGANGMIKKGQGSLLEGRNGMVFSQFGKFWAHHLNALVSIQRVYARTLSPQEWGEHFESTRGIFNI